ncbi:hypothetical protein GUJ93_ZPchr0008g12360 [Zizania palustris]|uniref:Protein transport protein Sec61 subunit beta n=1 Tax=Zizania palustris TaxID=103762 RepID=A0A8J5R3D6_ZIZPA|nr:hypothetical protein GUJ93_ZPchr0008g12360 [Zizania palustris]
MRLARWPDTDLGGHELDQDSRRTGSTRCATPTTASKSRPATARPAQHSTIAAFAARDHRGHGSDVTSEYLIPQPARVFDAERGRRIPHSDFGNRLTGARAARADSPGSKNEMAANGEAPARGSAAAAASLRRRRTTSGSSAAGGGASTMLQFYTDETAGRKMSPNSVLIMSIGFIAVVALLHVCGKLYRTSA